MAKQKKQKIKPLNDRIIVRRLEAVDTSEGGIVLPDAAKDEKVLFIRSSLWKVPSPT